MLLSSLNRLRSYIAGPDGTRYPSDVGANRDLMMWLTSVSDQISRYLNRTLTIGEYVEYFDVTYNKDTFQVRAYPITSITNVYEDSSARWNGYEWLVDTTVYFISSNRDWVQLWQPRGYIANKGMKITYVGGLASHAVNSVWTASITGTLVVGNFVTGGTSGAVGKIVAFTATTITIETWYGQFTTGETITMQATEGGNNVAGVSASLTERTSSSLLDVAPSIVTACEMEVRYNWKNKLKFEAMGTEKDKVSLRSTKGDKGDVYGLQPETLKMLAPFRRYAF